MLLGSVEESGDQHAHLTILTFSHSCCFCQFSQSKQSLTKCNVFPISQMSCISTYSFESQSSPCAIDYFKKPPTCPTFYEWGWICYRLRMIFNLKHNHIQTTHTIKYTQLVLAYETQKWSKSQTARIHKSCTMFVQLFFSPFLSLSSNCCTRVNTFCSIPMYSTKFLKFSLL